MRTKPNVLATAVYGLIAAVMSVFAALEVGEAFFAVLRRIYGFGKTNGLPKWLSQTNRQMLRSAMRSYKRLPFFTKISLTRSFIQGFLGYKRGKAPFITVLDVTYVCNLQCEGCFSSDVRNNVSLDEHVLEERLRDLYDNHSRVIIISGGEPTCYRKLYGILGRFPEMFFYVFTNGTQISESLAEEILGCRNVFHFVSVDGNEETITKRRGAGVYTKIQDCVRLFRSKRIPFGVSSTISRSNKEYVSSPAFYTQYADLGASCVLYLLVNVVNCENPEFVDSEGYRAFSSAIENNRKTGRQVLTINLPWDESRFSSKGCFAGSHILHIDLYGGVRICPFSREIVANLGDFGGFAQAYPFVLASGRCNLCAQNKTSTIALDHAAV